MLSLKKIVVTGPESSGKTTLAQQLALHFSTEWVPEYARTYLGNLHRPYQQKDLLEIARGQVALEDALSLQADHYLFCDTGLEVIKIWSWVKYQTVDSQLESLLATRSYDYFLLCQPDLDWQPDPLRETTDEQERWQLFEYYEKELDRSGIPFTIISGRGKARLQRAIEAVGDLPTDFI